MLKHVRDIINSYYILTVLVLLLIYGMFSQVNAKKKGKLVINYDSDVLACDDGFSIDVADPSGLHAIRVNESTAKLEGQLIIKKKIDGLVKLIMLMAKVMPGGGEETLFTYTVPDFCDEIKNRFSDKKASVVRKYLRAIDFSETCPIEVGTYSVVNMIADISQIPVNAAMEGQYTITFKFYDSKVVGQGILATTKDTLRNCMNFKAVIEPGV